MKDFEKFDLNQQTPTIATDNTLPLPNNSAEEGIFQGIETMMFSAFLTGKQEETFHDWYARNKLKQQFQTLLTEYATLRAEKARKEATDEAFEMHKLHMLLNYLEDLGIKAKWESTHWAVEQSGILLKFLDWFDGDLGVLKNHDLLVHEYFTEKLKP